MSNVGEKLVGEKKEAAAQQPQQYLTMNAKLYSLERFQADFVDVSVKEVDLLNELEVSKVYHCDGLVLCVAKDKKEEPKLVLWNPYLCQTRWIEPREEFNKNNRFAIGYDDGGSGSGSDSQRNHKIMSLADTFGPERKHELVCEIYEIRSNSWRVLDVVKDYPKWSIDMDQRGVSVKGNTYFFAHHLAERVFRGLVLKQEEIFLICFDFAKERFGPRLPFPFDSFDGFNGDLVTLSSFVSGGGDEQLAVLFGGYESGFFEIWVTLTVDPNGASWSKFLRMDPGPFCSYGFQLYPSSGGSFLVDEDNKLAVLFELDQTQTTHKAFVFGQDGSFKSSVILGQALLLENRSYNKLYKAARPPLVSSSPYRPSSVQLNQTNV